MSDRTAGFEVPFLFPAHTEALRPFSRKQLRVVSPVLAVSPGFLRPGKEAPYTDDCLASLASRSQSTFWKTTGLSSSGSLVS